MSLAKSQQRIQCTSSAHLFIDERGGLRSTRFNDIYFYPEHGAEETQHVFLQGNQLESRWLANDVAEQFVIAETGFGSGLNFLACWDLWRKCQQPGVKPQTLYFYSTELYPLTLEALKKSLAHYNPFAELAEQLCQCYPDPVGGDYLLSFDENTDHPVKLILMFGDSTEALSRLESYPPALSPSHSSLLVDAWFLDGFAPSQNPEMWQAALFAQIARHSKPGTTVATFSVARQVRELLGSNGFHCSKAPGFGRKRDMLTAVYQDQNKLPQPGPQQRADKDQSHNPCYFRYAEYARQSALVIGSGIAGASIAYKLARTGWQVSVVDGGDRIANGASGNARAVLYARSAAQRSALADFHEAAFHYALQFYRQLDNPELSDGLCGMIKLDEQLHATLLEANTELYSRENVDMATASKLAGLPVASSGIHYPDSGWLDPVAVCQHLIEQDKIQFYGNQSIEQIQYQDGFWQLQTSDQKQYAANIVVIACGTDSQRFEQSHWLPLKSLRGQTSAIAASDASRELKLALCQQGYITPEHQGLHECGATYAINDSTATLRIEDHQQNIDNVRTLLPSAFGEQNIDQKTAAGSIQGRVGFRCGSPDYLPIVGPLMSPTVFKQKFATLAKNARLVPDAPASLYPGLFVSTAFGSHGFTTAPLAAELLLAQINGTPLPLSDKLRQHLSPARFLVRQLIRGQ